MLIAFAFAGAGIAGTTFMRSWLDFDFVNLAIIPMFLFSATFFPISQYPDAVATVVRLTPLYQGVALERALVLGKIEWILLVHVALPAGHGLGRPAHRHPPPRPPPPALSHPRQRTGVKVRQ